MSRNYNCCKFDYYVTPDKQLKSGKYKHNCKICKTESKLFFDGKTSRGKKADKKITDLILYNQLIDVRDMFEKMPKEQTCLTFIPLKHYEPVNGEKQKEMYASGRATGFKFESKINYLKVS